MSDQLPNQAEVVICGAGISGIAAAYFLSVKMGITDVLLLDKGPPLSLTSDKSTECYRNWWPGPGNAMVSLMNRSISLMEEMASENGNIFQMNQRGYLYASNDLSSRERFTQAAREAAELGAGALRVQDSDGNSYIPHQAEGLEQNFDGADLILAPELIRKHFPFLDESVSSVLHVRRAGWLSAQQYGMWMLEEAKQAGMRFIQGELLSLQSGSRSIEAVSLAGGREIKCNHFVNAAGPMIAEIGKMLNLELPVYNELHLKSGIVDRDAVLDRDAPLVINADAQRLNWSKDESVYLHEDSGLAWLTEELPAGAHTRPEGSADAQNILVLWDTRERESEAIFPPLVDPMEAEIAIRGLVGILPGMQAYVDKMPHPVIDGGYYTKSRENRPLACPMSVEGSYVIGASSGYGIMAAAALGELIALQIAGQPLPEYAEFFDLKRYEDPDYRVLLDNWGESWQL